MFELNLKAYKMLENYHLHGVIQSVAVKNYRAKATQHERLLDAAVRLCQYIAAFFIFGAIAVVLEKRSRQKQRRSQAESLLTKLKKVKELKWSEN